MKTKSVLIPTIAADAGNSRLLAVHAESKLPGMPLSAEEEWALSKNLSLIAAPLQQHNLYRAGNVAAECVRYFLLHRRGCFCKKPWLNRLRLHASGATEGDSAQLGLALALLLVSRPPAVGVIATGKIGGWGRNVRIERVSDVPQKLALALKERQAGKLPAKRYVFFTPVDYTDAQGNTLKTAALEIVRQLAQLQIDVAPIRRLDEAVQRLDLLPGSWRDLRFWAAAAVLTTVALAYNSFTKPIGMQFKAIKPGFGAQPFLTCQKGNAKRADYYPIAADGYGHVVGAFAGVSVWNMALNWQVALPEAQGFDALLQEVWGGYALSYLNVGERTGLKANAMPGRLMPGQVWKWAWQLQEPAEEQNNLLLLLASRRPLDLAALENAFNRRFPARPIDLTAARNYLARQAPGALPFIYQVKKTEHPCHE